MKEIKAVIRPTRLDDVRAALMKTPGFPGMTVSHVEGCSAPARHQPQNLKEELLDFAPKVRIEIVAADEHAGALYETIRQAASTGHVGDGLVWMSDVGRCSFLWHPDDQLTPTRS
ncbi:P-II family nitrogen regulator [Pigmentiphaga sp.]|jgi:Nitrogen regulatory protein PII|uniref:P-II family nitrogen regulator n=1 Tax=Pigmentiphaga sp. TaxID=1977564 RepID=UPI0025DB4A86|nr:P-II family nitrogen regulator [Pigmentiphaga sp.]MBX6318342.1 P-II family nitrogen regulator [Pigmentiphaga sp.]